MTDNRKGTPNKGKESNFSLKVRDKKSGSWKPAYVLPDATDKGQGGVWLSDVADSSLGAANGITAATPKAIYDVERKVEAARSEAQQKIENLKIGGRNLLLGSRKMDNPQWWSAQSGTSLSYGYKDPFGGTDAVKIEPSSKNEFLQYNPKPIDGAGKYTLSVYMKADKPSQQKVCVRVRSSERQTDTSSSDTAARFSASLTTEWKRYCFTFNATDDFEVQNPPYFWLGQADLAVFYVAYPKIEHGEIATDYSEAPEDIELRNTVLYTSSKQAENKAQCQKFATDKLVKWSFENSMNLVGNNQNKMLVHDRKMNLAINDTEGGTWYIKYLYKGNDNWQPIGYEYIPVPEAVGQVAKAVDSLQVGGINLLRDTKEMMQPNAFWGGTPWQVANERDPYGNCVRYRKGTWSGMEQKVALEPRKTYTLSCWAKGDSAAKLAAVVQDSSNMPIATSSGPYTADYTTPNKWQRISITFPYATDNKGLAKVRIESMTDITLYIGSPKLEEGNKPTAYSEAPEDIDLRNDVLYMKLKGSPSAYKTTLDYATRADSVFYLPGSDCDYLGPEKLINKSMIFDRKISFSCDDKDGGKWTIHYLFKGMDGSNVKQKWQPVGYEYVPPASSKEEIKEALNDLRIGGVNLLTIGDHVSDNQSFSGGQAVVSIKDKTKIVKCTKVATSYCYFHLTNELEPWLKEELSRQEGSYTLSFDVMHNASVPFAARICDMNASNIFFESGFQTVAPNKWTHQVYTFTPKKANASHQYLDIIYSPDSFPQAGYEISVKNVQLERGNKATDYAESPADTELKEKTLFAALKNGCSNSQASAWSTQAVREIASSEYTVKGQCDTSLILGRPAEFSVVDADKNVWTYSYLYAGYNKWNLVGYNMFPANTGPKGADGKSVPFTISNVKPPATGTPNSLYFWTV